MMRIRLLTILTSIAYYLAIYCLLKWRPDLLHSLINPPRKTPADHGMGI